MLRQILLIAVLTLLTAVIYWPTHRFGVIGYDDPQYLYDNPHIRQGITAAGTKDAFFDLHYANYDPPLATLSFELDQDLFGLRPGIMHVENVLLHLLTALLLWRMLLAAGGEMNLSFAVAALFVCHPMHVESVAWISERKDVLSTPLLLAAMLVYVRMCRAPAGGRRWLLHALMLVLFTLSLLAKAMGVTLPALLLLLDFWPLRRWPGKSFIRLIGEKMPLVAIAGFLSVVQWFAQRQIGAPASLAKLSLIDRIDNAVVCYVIYLVKLAVPTNLAVFYPHPGSRPIAAVVAALALLVLISAICWRQRARRAYLIVGWLWFLISLLPVIGLVQIGAQAMADRYSYLPSIGVFVAGVWGIAGLVRNATIRLLIGAGVIAGFSYIAHRQVLYWENTETLFTHALEVTGENSVADVELGNIALQRGQIKWAVDEYTAAGANPRAYGALGNIWMADDRDKAIEYYRLALNMQPDSIAYRIQLAGALRTDGKLDEALQLAESAVRIAPDNPQARRELQRIMAARGDKQH